MEADNLGDAAAVIEKEEVEELRGGREEERGVGAAFGRFGRESEFDNGLDEAIGAGG